MENAEKRAETEENPFPEFDTIRLKAFIEEHTNVGIVVYLLSIVLYIVCFAYLFEKNSTEYIVWIVLFILNFITPVIWMMDMSKLYGLVSNQLPEFNKNVFTYGFFSLVISSIVSFITLFIVLLKNEKVRKVKKKQGHYQDTTETPTLKTDIRGIEKRDRYISIIYTTLVVLYWSFIAFSFGEYLKNVPIEREHFPFGSRIKALMDIVPNLMSWFDSSIHFYTKQINMIPLVKSFWMYVAVFLIVFFGVFARVKYTGLSDFFQDEDVKIKQRIELVNMGPLFTRQFDKEFYSIRIFVMLLIAFICTAVLGGLLMLSENMIPAQLKPFLILAAGFLLGLTFITKREELFPKEVIKNWIFFFLCVLFSLVSAPAFTGMTELVLSFIGVNMGKNAIFMMSFVAVIIFSIMYAVGMSNNWITKHGYRMKTFLVLLVTMTISLFFALSTEYSMFKNTYDLIAFVLRFVMKFIAPFAMVVLSIVTLYFANINYNIMRHRANDKIVHEVPPKVDSNQDTKNTIKDQSKIRNMINNAQRDFRQLIGVESTLKDLRQSGVYKSLFG
jgi:hypothetical protein